ncbi:MAG TPA: LLM class flavin-dependent oxidoreductase [Solirubrobacteraceae bacterium]|nr:LLM class flavin-dependent oxidoreductase [Solirubrobacteraceae bacterium]
MTIALHWYLPTHGDGRTLVQAGAAAQLLQETRRPDDGTSGREATLSYLGQVARAAEESGFDAVLTPTGTTCHDAWITCAALSQVTDRLRFLVAFRPGSIAPTLAAQQAATFQRHTGGRLALNIVTGGDDEEQRRFGDRLSKDERYARTDEFLTILRGAWSGEPFDFSGDHLWTEGAVALGMQQAPPVYFGGASDAALRVAARHADVALTWGDPPPRLAPHLEKVRDLAEAEGRELRFGIRLHVIARDTSDEAWAAADALIADADEATIAAVQQRLAQTASEGQRRMRSLHGGRRDELEVYPNLWAGIGLLRTGAGTALVGSHEEIADLMAEYHELGISEFILSGYPHVEEAYAFGEGVLPVLRRRGLVNEPVAAAA